MAQGRLYVYNRLPGVSRKVVVRRAERTIRSVVTQYARDVSNGHGCKREPSAVDVK